MQECFYSDPFQNIPEGELVERFRLEKETIRGLIDELSPFIPRPQRNDDVSVATKVGLIYWFLLKTKYVGILVLMTLCLL